MHELHLQGTNHRQPKPRRNVGVEMRLTHTILDTVFERPVVYTPVGARKRSVAVPSRAAEAMCSCA